MREVELKARLSVAEEELLLDRVRDLGFSEHGKPMVQLDLVLDTNGFAMRKNGLLLRLREETTDGERKLLLTLKIRNPGSGSGNVQDNTELELELPDPASATGFEILGIVNQKLGTAIPETLLASRQLRTGTKLLVVEAGLSQVRSALQKSRREFRRDGVAVCFDGFADYMGRFVELEAESPEEVQELASELRIDSSNLVVGNYGQLARQAAEAAGRSNVSMNVLPETELWLRDLLSSKWTSSE